MSLINSYTKNYKTVKYFENIENELLISDHKNIKICIIVENSISSGFLQLFHLVFHDFRWLFGVKKISFSSTDGWNIFHDLFYDYFPFQFFHDFSKIRPLFLVFYDL